MTLPVLQVAASLSLASSKTEALESSLDRLNGSLYLGLSEVASLKAAEARLNRLSASFNVLLKDASRHSQVLELLLGEDVLDFLDWPVEEQEEHSMPALLEELKRHSVTIKALQDGRQPGESPVQHPGGIKEKKLFCFSSVSDRINVYLYKFHF